jgi:hypothetical protein
MGQTSYQFQLLAPSQPEWLSGYPPVTTRPDLYETYLSSIQRLRGETYLADGAISLAQLDAQGRHRFEDDEQCWHFLLVDRNQNVIACARYRRHPATVCFDDLRLKHAAIAADPCWGPKLRAAVEADLRLVRARGESYVEIGGWAIAKEHRNTRAALDTLLASYAWGEMIGGCISTCTATYRNNSAPILRRIGGVSLTYAGEEIPPYLDPAYGCKMEILRFDSHVLDQRFVKAVTDMRLRLMDSVILCASAGTDEVLEEVAFQKSLVALGNVLNWNTNTFAALQRLEVKQTVTVLH